MTTESSNDGSINRCQRRPLQNHSGNEVSLGAVVGRALNDDGESRGLRQRGELESMHLVDSIGHAAGAAAVPVALGHHVDDVCCWIDNGCTSDANVIRDIVTAAQVRGEEWQLDLPLRDKGAVLGVVYSDNVHVGRCDDHLPPPIDRVSQWLGVPQLQGVFHLRLPQNTETRPSHYVRVHVVI
jgi:hypothetical protein